MSAQLKIEMSPLRTMDAANRIYIFFSSVEHYKNYVEYIENV